MKNILLIGDSIRQGYDKYVKQALDGTANVYFPSENCRFAQYILRNLTEWKNHYQWPQMDVVHWNAGLWDTIELFEDGTLSTPAHYEDTVKRINKRIRVLFPNAKIIFATSTPVLEHKYPDPKRWMRWNKDTERFNEIAKKAFEGDDIIINDLWELLRDVPESYYSDMTHLYTPEATKLIGTQVLRHICDAAEIPFRVLEDGYEFRNDNVIGI